jgi:SRSO17 transposase
VSEEVAFRTKSAIAREMIARALDGGTPCAWVLADALYGADSRLRRMLEARGQPYVLAVRGNHTLRFLEDWQLFQTDPATTAADLDSDQWQTLTAGEGAKGPRLYEWARVSLGRETPNGQTPDGFERWLLLRRNRHDRQALASYFPYAPAGTDLAELAGAAGLRWTIEECFLRAKDDLGLDHCEARSWHGWHRHMSLVMAAAAFLAKLAADQRRTAFTKADKTSPAAMTGTDPPCPALSRHPNCAR